MRLRNWLGITTVLIQLLFGATACKKSQSPEQLSQKLRDRFQSAGYVCELSPADENTDVPIYRASVWQILRIKDESILLYFDESNRADYLCTLIDAQTDGYVTHFGQRYVLCYAGTDERLLAFLETLIDPTV